MIRTAAQSAVTAQLQALRNLFGCRLASHVFLVGGSVRDIIAGECPRDLDLVAAVSPEELVRLGFRTVVPRTGPTVYFRTDPELGTLEVTLLSEPDELVNDLSYRDFTINAMAMSLSGDIHDPLGGMDDTARRLLIPCRDDIFQVDPLRIFRAFRFESFGWRLCSAGEHLIRGESWEQLLEPIPVERFSREMLQALAGSHPARFFLRMVQLDVGRCYLPELFMLAQVPSDSDMLSHGQDLLTSSLQTLGRTASVSSDPKVRFCTLFQRLGRLARTADPQEEDVAGSTMAQVLCQRLRLPVHYRKSLSVLCRLHTAIRCWDHLDTPSRLRVASLAVAGRVAELLPLVCLVDHAGLSVPQGWDELLRVSRMSVRELGIDPDQLRVMTARDIARQVHRRRLQLLDGV